MMKAILFILFCGTVLLFACSSAPELEQDGVLGLWKSRDQHSDKPRALVAIYKYQDMYYGRMLASYDDNGNINDTILEQKDRATGVVGHPPYCGMDFVYNMKEESNRKGNTPRYRGKIIDPQKGDVYKAEMWRSGNDLILRGELWIFGKNIPWHPATKSDLPKGFSMSDIKKFVPVVPKAI